MNDRKRERITELIESQNAIRIGEGCVLGYLAVGTVGYDQATRGKSPKSGKSPLGIVLRETLERHPDSLSVTGGIWQRSTDSRAPAHKMVWVTAGGDGKPDMGNLLREGGGIDKLIRGFGI